MGRQTVVYVLPPNFRNNTPVSLITDTPDKIRPDISSPDNAGAAAMDTAASAGSPRFSQTHSPNSVHIEIPPSPTLCDAVLLATYFCSWNLIYV